MSSQRRCSDLKPSGSFPSSQMMRSVQRRPNRSSAAINDRPVVEPRTGRPGMGVALMALRQLLCFGFRSSSIAHRDTASEIEALIPTGGSMPKGYWVSVYPAIDDSERLDAYSKLARPAVKAAGGRVLASIGARVEAHEAGIAERVVLIEFGSFEQAVAARASAAYQEALAALPDGFERDFRIVEGRD
jgi:uncharacterized protein (DUF1330 family)